MFSRKSGLFLLIIVVITIFSCKKDDQNEGITREDYFGVYHGGATDSRGGWIIKTLTISAAPFGPEFVFINGLVRFSEHQITATVDQDKISFKEQSFHVDKTSPGGAHSVYDAFYFGSGTLDTNSHEIIFHYTEKQVFSDTTFVIEWTCSAVRDSI